MSVEINNHSIGPEWSDPSGFPGLESTESGDAATPTCSTIRWIFQETYQSITGSVSCARTYVITPLFKGLKVISDTVSSYALAVFQLPKQDPIEFNKQKHAIEVEDIELFKTSFFEEGLEKIKNTEQLKRMLTVYYLLALKSSDSFLNSLKSFLSSNYPIISWKKLPPIIQELFELTKEERIKKVFNQEVMSWKGFTFTYTYANPEINAKIPVNIGEGPCFTIDQPILEDSSYSSHPDDLKRLWNECEKRGLLKEFFFEVAKAPEKFCVKNFINRTTEFPPLKISECACSFSGGYNRLVNNRRLNFENKMIQHLKDQKLNKDETIEIMSLGCGNLLQEAILIGRLIAEGFSSINMTLVDTSMPFSLEMMEASRSLPVFFHKNFPEVTVSFSKKASISEVDQNMQCDLIYAIDFNDLFKGYKNPSLVTSTEGYIATGDIIRARGLLKPSGSLFLGKHAEHMQLFLSEDIQVFHQRESLKELEAIKSAPLDSVAIVTNLDDPYFAFTVMISLLDKGCKKICFIMEKPDYLDDKTNFYELIPKFSNKVSVEFVDDIRPYLEDSHASFLDICKVVEKNFFSYKGAAHTVILEPGTKDWFSVNI